MIRVHALHQLIIIAFKYHVQHPFHEVETDSCEFSLDFTRFNRHLLRPKLNWSDSHEEGEIPSRI